MLSQRLIKTRFSFPPAPTERYVDGVNVLAEVVVPSFDAYGTQLCKGAATSADEGIRYQVGAGAADVLHLDIPGPTDASRIWKILSFCGDNSDVGNSRMMTIERKIGSQRLIVVSEWVSKLSAQGGKPQITLPRPIYLPAGWSICCSIDSIVAGGTLSCTLAYIDMPLGEYTLTE